MKTEDLELFIRTADSGSITAAAQQLDITTATASAALKRLEQQLGAPLFIRSTRQLRITREGERFLVHCRAAIENLKAGCAAVVNAADEISGRLRISVSSDLGRNMMLDWLDEVMESHPKLEIDLQLGDSIADFYRDRVDIAIRYGKQADSSMVAFPMGVSERILCASPSYLSRFEAIKEPNDLLKHNCLLFTLHGRLYDTWELSYPDENNNTKSVKLKVSGNRASNDADVVRRWAVAGRGIAFKSRLDMSNDLKAGRVVQVLPEVSDFDSEVSLIVPSRQQVTPAILYIRDYLRQKIAQQLLPVSP